MILNPFTSIHPEPHDLSAQIRLLDLNQEEMDCPES